MKQIFMPLTIKLSLFLMAVILVFASPMGTQAAFAEAPVAISDVVETLDAMEMVGDEGVDGVNETTVKEVKGLPQLDISTYARQIFWMCLFFGFLYVIFAKKTLPEISSVIQNRKNHIESDLESAEKLTAEADAVHDLYSEGLVQAQAHAAQALSDVEAEMKVKSAQAFEEFRGRTESEVEATESRIEAAKLNMMDEMNNIAAEAASVAVEKIIGQSTDASKVKQILENMNGKAKAA